MINAVLSMLKTDEQKKELAEFYKKNKNRIYAVAYSKIHNRETTEDVIQEAFLNIVKYPKSFFSLDDDKRISYMLTVLGNTISRYLKNFGKNRFDELDDEIDDGALSVEDIAIGKIAAEELKKFIKELSETRRSVIELKLVHGLSNSQIADVLNISEEAVRKRISNTYKQIRTFLNEGSVNDRNNAE